MKVNYTRWRTYSTPYLSVINNKDYLQVSLVVLCYHWYIIIKRNSNN